MPYPHVREARTYAGQPMAVARPAIRHASAMHQRRRLRVADEGRAAQRPQPVPGFKPTADALVVAG